MDTPTINAEKREKLGTRYARRLRSAGRTPGVLYGHKKDPIALSVNEREMMNCLHLGSRLITVDLEGDSQTCLVKDFQFDHLGSDIVHIDFARVDLTEEVEVTVNVHFTGDAIGLKTTGTIFRTVIDSVTIRCQAGAIPSELMVDVSELEAGAYIAAGAIELPAGSELVTDEARVVCRISLVQEAVEEVDEVEGEGVVEGAVEGDADVAAPAADDGES